MKHYEKISLLKIDDDDEPAGRWRLMGNFYLQDKQAHRLKHWNRHIVKQAHSQGQTGTLIDGQSDRREKERAQIFWRRPFPRHESARPAVWNSGTFGLGTGAVN
jgi:hypothetical protein